MAHFLSKLCCFSLKSYSAIFPHTFLQFAKTFRPNGSPQNMTDIDFENFGAETLWVITLIGFSVNSHPFTII